MYTNYRNDKRKTDPWRAGALAVSFTAVTPKSGTSLVDAAYV